MIEQHFSRYEFKYVVPLEQRLIIEDQLQHFMRFDDFISNRPKHQYLVRSLYFDSPTSQAFYEKIDGIKERRKYRIRTYSQNQDSTVPLFLEEKGRHNQRTFKHRIKIDPLDYRQLIRGENVLELVRRYPDANMVGRFVRAYLNLQLQPKVLVDYARRPYVSDYDVYFRVTFDQKLQATPSNSLFPASESQMRSCVAGSSIIEVKFNRRIPAWFHRIIQTSQLRRVSISKFVVGMASCGIATDLS